MWSSSRRDRCIRSALLIAVSILCISLVFISLAHRGTEQQVIGEILNGNSLLPERLIKEKCIPVCDSKDCVFQANMLLNSINPEVDPCENFQTFLCGTFEQRFGRDEHGYSGIGKAHLMMLKKMKDAIESIDAPPGSAFSKMKIVYDSCVNIEIQEQFANNFGRYSTSHVQSKASSNCTLTFGGSSDLRGAEDFKQFLTDIEILNWPHLPEDFTFSEDGLPVLLGTLTSYLEAMFLTINIQSGNTEYPNETYVEVFFSPHSIEIPTTVQRDAAFEILKYFDIETEDIELILNDYNNVKSTLSNLADEITWEEDCKIVVIDCLRPGDKDLVDLCKAVDVFLNLTDLNGIITKPGISVREDNLLTVKKIISNLKSLPNRSVANFFALRLLWNHLDEINLFFRRKKLKYYQYFKREDRKKPEMANKNRWLYCVEWIEENMKLPLEKIYVEKYLEQSIIDEIHDMHVNYTSEIADMFVQQEWIPMGIRFACKMWIMNLKNSFSRLQELLPSETFLNDYMKLFYPKPASFFLNVMEDRKSKLRAYHLYKIDPTALQTPSFKVNAAFSEDGAEIAYHYGIIFPPFHYPGHIRLINRILFAHIVVHEIGHGVVGLLTQISESTNSTKKTFLEKKHCIENQFSKFEFKYLGGNLNGTQYFDENLSDNLAQAFLDKLLQNFESSEDAISLPGLRYSPKQQLYMSSAEGFCSKSNLKIDIHFKTEDVHAPLEYRIIGTMQNSREYAEAFQCPVGSYMNPAVKCSLFD